MQVTIVDKASVVDWFGQPNVPLPPPAGQARMYYDSEHHIFGVIDSYGNSLLQGAGDNFDGGTF